MHEDKQNWQELADYWFKLHTELSNNFDVRIADYYSDEAYLQNTVISEDGSQRHRIIPGPVYKNAIRNLMGFAKERGDTYTISEVEYGLHNGRAKATYMRCSDIDNFKSPVKVIYGIFGDEAGTIFEEYSISKGQ